MHTFQSDIEEILQSQTWKHKHLHPIQSHRRGFKSRCMTERDNAKKHERFITQPYLKISDSLVSSPSPEPERMPIAAQLKPKKSSLYLPVHLPTILKEIFSISSRSSNTNLQVPIFPKREFGNSIKTKIFDPKFKNFQKNFNDEKILEMKLESGRVRKKIPNLMNKRFRFLDDLNSLKCEKAIERMQTIYFNAE
jgi:hypothetical protein